MMKKDKCQKLEHEQISQISGGGKSSGKSTWMRCQNHDPECGYATTWAGDYAGKGPYQCPECKQYTLYADDKAF